MSRARHKEEKKRASGGKLSSKPVWNAGGEQNAAKEALERKRGGRAEHMHAEGEKAKERHDRPKRARGGKVEERKHGGKMEHEERKDGGHVEMKHRAKGGRVKGAGIGANRTPLSTAAKIDEVTPGEQAEGANED